MPSVLLGCEHAHGYDFATQLSLKTGDASLVGSSHAPPFLDGARAHDSQGDNLINSADSALANGDPADRRELIRLSLKECRLRCCRRRIAGAAAWITRCQRRREDGAEEDD